MTVTKQAETTAITCEAEAGAEIMESLAALARRSRRAGLPCASAALDQAVISVFNALFADRAAQLTPLASCLAASRTVCH